jgi:hypothetical protein
MEVEDASFPSRAVVAGVLTVGSSLLPVAPRAAEFVPRVAGPRALSGQAATLASDYIDRHNMDDRYLCSVEPTGDGNLVSFRSGFDAGAKPPVQSRW